MKITHETIENQKNVSTFPDDSNKLEKENIFVNIKNKKIKTKPPKIQRKKKKTCLRKPRITEPPFELKRKEVRRNSSRKSKKNRVK